MHLRDLSNQNQRRDPEAFPSCEDWTLSDWMLALFGEAGEVANLLKKANRDESLTELRTKIAAEMADVLGYLDLLAGKCGISLEEAFIRKWNLVSEVRGNPRRLIQTSRFWFVASPYTKYVDGYEAAFTEACKFTARLLDLGIHSYSPIVATHPLVNHIATGRADVDYWGPFSLPFMESACGMIVCRMAGWDVSKGIAGEIEYVGNLGKPILYFDPDHQFTTSELAHLRIWM